MPLSTDTLVPLFLVTGAWCGTAVYLLRTHRIIALAAIKRARPRDLADVLKALA